MCVDKRTTVDLCYEIIVLRMDPVFITQDYGKNYFPWS